MTLVSNIQFIETSRYIMIKKNNFVWPNHQVDGAIKRHVLCGLNRCLACMNMHICVYEYESVAPQNHKKVKQSFTRRVKCLEFSIKFY